MTGHERIDLLKEVARVAPEDLCATFTDFAELVQFDAGRYISDLRLSNDFQDALPIIVMLDAMESKPHPNSRHRVGLITPTGGAYACDVWIEETGDRPYGDFRGSTRAEAVAKAFVAVFSTDTPTEPKEHQEDDNGKD